MRMRPLLALLLTTAFTACTAAPPPPPDDAANENAAPAVVDTTATVPYDFRAVDFLDIARGWVIGSDVENNVSVVAHTVNGGATWVVLVELVGDTLLDVDFVDEQRGWTIGTAGIVYETVDGGRTWTPSPAATWTPRRRTQPTMLPVQGEGNISPSINESIASIVFVDAKTGWAAGDAPTGNGFDVRGLVLGTADGGATWTELKDAAGKTAPYSITDLWFVSPTEGWAAGGNHEDREEDILLHTVDGGRTWERVPTGTAQYLRSVHFVDASHGWTVGMTLDDEDMPGPSKVLATADGGRTWTVQLTSPRSFFDVQFANAQRGWAVGDRAAIWATTDGGATWRQQTRFQMNQAKTVTAPTGGTPDPDQRALRTVLARDAATVWAGGEGVILERVKR